MYVGMFLLPDRHVITALVIDLIIIFVIKH